MDNVLPLAPSPKSTQFGYFIVNLEPKFPSTHSILPFSWTKVRLVTKLYTLLAQFWIVVYLTCASLCTIISTTAECSELVEYTGAVQPST